MGKENEEKSIEPGRIADEARYSLAISFEEIEKTQEIKDIANDIVMLAEALKSIVYNIVSRSDIDDKYSAMERATSEFLDRAKLLITSNNDEKSKSAIEKTKGAVSRFFNSIKEKISTKEKSSATVENKNVDENPFMIWKEADGTYRWFGIYSNMYRDTDNEIISKASHKRFVELVDSGQAAYPELWHFHIKNTKWGQSDWLAFDEETGFALASGYVLKGFENEAEAVLKRGNVKMSHGMPPSSIVRDEQDKSIIKEHITLEISDLPDWAAANELTDFKILLKEVEMPIPNVKKQYLKELGVSDETIANLENSLGTKAKEASDAGLEFKEKDVTEQATQSDVTAEVLGDNVQTETTTKDNSEVKESDKTLEQIADVLATFKLDFEKSISDLREKVSSLEKEKQAEQVSDESLTPPMSLAEMIVSKMRAVGSKEAEVKNKDKLGEPEQAPTIQGDQSLVNTGNVELNNIFNKIIGGK